MTDTRLRSGHQPLDDVLGGGLPANGISVIMGLPGTGKTIIAQQYTFRNARPDRPAVYFSTLSEPLEKILRFGQTLGFFDPSAVGASVFYEDLGLVASRDGLAGVADHVTGVLKQRRPGLVVIDSFKALQALAADDGEFRQFLHQLAGRLTAFPVASLWVGEYETAEIALSPEFAVADAIVELATVPLGQREKRFLTVRKLRGSGFRSGQHGYRLTSEGLHLFPRLADIPAAGSYPLGDHRIPSGIPGLDPMLGGGLWPGACTMVAGPSGSGKTVMGLHFIFGGARHGEPGVIATLQENPTQLRRMLAGLGWPTAHPAVEVMYRSPVDIYIDEWVYELLETVQRTAARRVLLDSLLDLQDGGPGRNPLPGVHVLPCAAVLPPGHQPAHHLRDARFRGGPARVRRRHLPPVRQRDQDRLPPRPRHAGAVPDHRQDPGQRPFRGPARLPHRPGRHHPRRHRSWRSHSPLIVLCSPVGSPVRPR